MRGEGKRSDKRREGNGTVKKRRVEKRRGEEWRREERRGENDGLE